MNRKTIIIGNWKLNLLPSESKSFFNDFKTELENNTIESDFAFAVPFTSIHAVNTFDLPVAAQNFASKTSGALTGEVSILALEELNIKYAIIGHSERRQIFNETNESINAKLKLALTTSVIPVVAFGETEEQFNNGTTNEVIEEQITKAFEGVTDIKNTILAYEPIWAIGTGKVATPEQAQNSVAFSRSVIEKLYGQEIAQKVRIQYGGSVNGENAKEILSQPDIDGALVGGASLKVNDFMKILNWDN